VLGAFVALCDGMVWAELGAAMPGHRRTDSLPFGAYGPQRLGRLMSFLLSGRLFFLAPLSIASGAIGLRAVHEVPRGKSQLVAEKGIAMGICLLITFLLYRDIRTIAKLSVGMWLVVLGTVYGSPLPEC